MTAGELFGLAACAVCAAALGAVAKRSSREHALLLAAVCLALANREKTAKNSEKEVDFPKSS